MPVSLDSFRTTWGSGGWDLAAGAAVIILARASVVGWVWRDAALGPDLGGSEWGRGDGGTEGGTEDVSWD